MGRTEFKQFDLLRRVDKPRHASASGNAVADYYLATAGSRLRYLDLEWNQIYQPRATLACTNLNYLNLGQNQVSDLSPLAACPNLTGLTSLQILITNLELFPPCPCFSILNVTRTGLAICRLWPGDDVTHSP